MIATATTFTNNPHGGLHEINNDEEREEKT
jgi:hypothetical protein